MANWELPASHLPLAIVLPQLPPELANHSSTLPRWSFILQQLHQSVATSLSLVLQLCGDPWLSHLFESRRLAQVRRPPARREPVLSSLPCLDLDPAESSWPRLSLILLLAPASTLRESFTVSRRCEVSCSCEASAAVAITGLHNCRFFTVSCSDRCTGGPMEPVTGLEYPHCVTVARQNYSAVAALRASKHASQTLNGLSLRAS